MEEKSMDSQRTTAGWIIGGTALAVIVYGLLRVIKRPRSEPYVIDVTVSPSGISVWPEASIALRGFAIVWRISNRHASDKEVIMERFEPRPATPPGHPLVDERDPKARVRSVGHGHAVGVVKPDLPQTGRDLRYKYTIRVPGQPSLDPEIVIVRGG